jgi:hypothetical protein
MKLAVFRTEALYIPEAETYTFTPPLTESVVAVELLRTSRGTRLGRISRIPEGACLDICGDGYNDRTVKVRWQGQIYFVLRQDLEAA